MAMFDVSFETEYRVITFEVKHDPWSNLRLRVGDCERCTWRSFAGNEILTHYNRHIPIRNQNLRPYEEIDFKPVRWYGNTREQLRHNIATDLAHYYDRGLNWNWNPIAEFLSSHVHAMGAEGENFNLEVEEIVVEHAVVDQNKPYWEDYFEMEDHVDMFNRQRVPEECPICSRSVADPNARIGLKCGHVYCKKCLYAWIWRNANCPTCRARIYGGD